MKDLFKVAFLAVLFALPASVAAEVLDLKYKTYRQWDLVLPQEVSSRVSGDFLFPGVSPDRFKVQLDGTALRLDRNADGTLDSKVEGDAGVVTLIGRTEEGEKFRYAVRLARLDNGWHFAASGASLGILDGQKIRIIDQNNNGRYDEYGVDAMVIGQGRYARFLSRIIPVRDRRYRIEVTRDGSRLTYEPFDGERGTLDLTTQFATKGKLLSAIVRSPDGDTSFNLTGQPLPVPAGVYQLYRGRIGLGRNVVNFSRGNFETIRVAANQTRTLSLGEPVDIDFTYVRQGGRVIMAPQWVRYLGRGGEVYDDWTPFGGSPQFDVRDVATGMQIALAVFGGT